MPILKAMRWYHSSHVLPHDLNEVGKNKESKIRTFVSQTIVDRRLLASNRPFLSVTRTPLIVAGADLKSVALKR